MKTAKITSIDSVKQWTGPNGMLYYHKLQMENGDKIDIGKKTEMSVGKEIHYSITGPGQGGYQKAKSEQPQNNTAFTSPNQQPNDDRQKSIVRQSCLKGAIERVNAIDNMTSDDFGFESIKTLAEKLEAWVNR